MKNYIILVLGMKGSGKTYFVKTKLLPRIKRYVVIDILDEYAGYCVRDFPEFLEADRSGRSRIVCKFTDDLDVTYALLYLWERGEITVVLEEVDQQAASFSINPALEQLIKYGRHRNLSIIGVTRRPFEITALLRSQADSVVTFRQGEPRDLVFLREAFGGDPGTISSLPPHHYAVLREDPFSLLTNRP